MNVIEGDYKKKIGYAIFKITKHYGDMCVELCITLFCMDGLIVFYTYFIVKAWNIIDVTYRAGDDENIIHCELRFISGRLCQSPNSMPRPLAVWTRLPWGSTRFWARTASSRDTATMSGWR